MPHLLNVWPAISDRLLRSGETLLLFDYDGTLTPIVSRPELAILCSNTREMLRDLSLTEKYSVGIVSGRSLEDVTARVDLPGLIYAGNHGLEIRGPGIDFIHPEALEMKSALARICLGLQDRLSNYEGVIVEDKGLTLSVHRRMVPETLKPRVEAEFMSALKPYQESRLVRVTRGSEVLEVRPNVTWDKGKAIAKLNEVYQQATLTFYFGDDVTDEDAFEVVEASGGIAVFVGPPRRPTRASYRVDSPQEVRVALQLLGSL